MEPWDWDSDSGGLAVAASTFHHRAGGTELPLVAGEGRSLHARVSRRRRGGTPGRRRRCGSRRRGLRLCLRQRQRDGFVGGEGAARGGGGGVGIVAQRGADLSPLALPPLLHALAARVLHAARASRLTARPPTPAARS